MSKQSEESLSALVDGECLPGELELLLAEFETEPGLMARWSRQCAARDACDGVKVRAGLDLTIAVMEAISEGEAPAAHPSVVKLRRPQPAVADRALLRRRTLRWRPVAGMAAAASIAVVAVVVGRAVLVSQGNVRAQVASAPLATESRGSRWAEIDPAAARQLDGYLMEHSNTRDAAGMGGSLSYARLAVHSADYRPDESH